MIPTRIGESQGRILEHLKRRGSGTIPEMARELDLSVETVRTHLKSLGSDGFVERSGRRRNGPGRPEIIYRLTAGSEVLFPNQEGTLLQDLAAYLLEAGREDLVRGFFDAQVERRRATMEERLDSLGDDARMQEVARMLTDEGFMAEVTTHEGGEKRLRLCHCPVRSLVDVTKAPCRSELRFVRELLGKRLVRVSYIPSGDASCCYALKEAG
ncbi:MAG TPA: helix-turn-helix domain-containing protein [Longimicrobiales bacterium]|nr:helix-turn-helix domain-containing protein [Longimicrobiales bacterium]